ncbi:uncharacterized protein ACB058_008900 [Synchiropus picturatus]
MPDECHASAFESCSSTKTQIFLQERRCQPAAAPRRARARRPAQAPQTLPVHRNTGPTIHTKTVNKQGRVSIPCPPIPSEANVTIILERDKKILTTLVLYQTPGSRVQFSGKFDVEPQNGTYECTMTKRYPPPVRQYVNITTVEVIEGSVASAAPTAAAPLKLSSSSPVSHMIPWWVACGVLLIYSLSITCFLVQKKIKRMLKTKQNRNALYANTNPRDKLKTVAK